MGCVKQLLLAALFEDEFRAGPNIRLGAEVSRGRIPAATFHKHGLVPIEGGR